jgi:dipeptidyl aminopeptidase/acylaminoacyl peptidase
VAALRGLDRQVDYLELAGEGHDYRRAESRRTLTRSAVSFLAAHLRPVT